jgi:hypothetical protein
VVLQIFLILPMIYWSMGCRIFFELQRRCSALDGISLRRKPIRLPRDCRAAIVVPQLEDSWRRTRRISMHDLLIALAFIGMVIAPAIVATKCHMEATDDSE